MRFYFIRHGTTINNQQHVFNGGHVDPTLTAAGKQEAQKLGEDLQQVHFDLCFSSPLKRARKTAELVLSKNKTQLPQIQLLADLTEMNLGDWDGRPLAAIAPSAELENYFNHPALFSGIASHAESYVQVRDRGFRVLDSICQRASAKDNILVASHGLLLTTLLNSLRGVPLDEVRRDGLLPTSSVTIFEADSSQNFKLIEWAHKPSARRLK
ncbi:phosphoglycerate mutase [Ligilactobacillus salitolerans]|uniref:Phosphoglycerate mutase n=2 Tax=Ligilactobacillus salitolerans TaxID=1808352 RepID=A0A401IWC5_9LACO|nr:phosphoglycerate mutase [Ligilactobacillus salitolerans]